MSDGSTQQTSAMKKGLSPSESDVVRQLSEVDWSFADADSRQSTHALHPYPAKFIPQIPRALIERLTCIGDLVWDPFGGSGTTALEALIAGRDAISSDLNPIAQIIGRAKTTTIDRACESDLRRLADDFYRLSRQSLPMAGRVIDRWVPAIPNISKWFSAAALSELTHIRESIEELTREEAKLVALSCFSKVITAASNQDSETRYSAVEKNHQDGHVFGLFHRSLSDSIDRLKKVASAIRYRQAQFITADARRAICSSEEFNGFPLGAVDAVITSPPYPNATDYFLYHRFRMFWLGFDPRKMGGSEIGSHLRNQKNSHTFEHYLDEMRSVLENVESALRPGGYAALVVGDGKFEGQIYSTSEGIAAQGESVGLKFIATVDRALPTHRRSFSSPARRLREEQIVLLRKPPTPSNVRLFFPPYKMQPYEQELALLEAKRVGTDVELLTDRIEVVVGDERRNKLRDLSFVDAFTSHADSSRVVSTLQKRLERPHSGLSKKDSKYFAHGIHPYKGKFYPQLAKSLLNIADTPRQGTVLDPFCGSGTVPLEVVLTGRRAIGLDVNPVAIQIARVKADLAKTDLVLRCEALEDFVDRVSQRQGPHTNDGIDRHLSPDVMDEAIRWFPPKVLSKLAVLLRMIKCAPDQGVADHLAVLLSGLIREASHQDPRDLRIRRRADPIDDFDVYGTLIEKVKDSILRIREACRAGVVPDSAAGHASIVHESSSGDWIRKNLALGEVDAVITSPPYATALPYIDTDRLSLLVLHNISRQQRTALESVLIGTREILMSERRRSDERIEAGDFEGCRSPLAAETIKAIRDGNARSSAGFRKLNTPALLLRYFEQMADVASNLTHAVKVGGSAFVVIGDNRTNANGDEILIRSGEIISQQFASFGWERVGCQPITVSRESVVHAKNTITRNDILWFKRR